MDETAERPTAFSPSGFDLAPPSPETRLRIEADLTAEERDVLLRHGTEPPFCGTLLSNKRAGVYCCRLCGLPLFRAGAKFESGTGWPSFTAPYDPAHLKFVTDSSLGMVRTEIRCTRCESHQGHVFPDGPPPRGLRFCINSVALAFIAEDEHLPDPLDRKEGGVELKPD